MADDNEEISAFSIYKTSNPTSNDDSFNGLKKKKKKKKDKLNFKINKPDKKHKKSLSNAIKSVPAEELFSLGQPISKNLLNGVTKKSKSNLKNEKSKFKENGTDKPKISKIVKSPTPILAEPIVKKSNKIKKNKTKKKKKKSIEPSKSELEDIVTTDSYQEGKDLFSWLIAPSSADSFFEKYWEKKPFLIQQRPKDYYKDIISTPLIDGLLRTEEILFTKNMDITSYVNGQRETHNPSGRALPHVVWDYYLNGCSIRLLNPQTYIPKLHLLNATLQEYFHCFVGANSYLTPPNTQGFAPHYDDIEAFILQVEGKKLWKVYAPLSKDEVLPRVSSKNFDQSEIGDPVMEVTLEPGDLLYFPRGFIHQGVTVDNEHSLHVTVSCYQKQSWADLLEKLVPQALENAIRDDVKFREGVPLDIFNHLGLVHSDSNTTRRGEIIDKIKKLFNNIVDYMQMDDGVDQLSKKFMGDALPPVLNEKEKDLTVYGSADRMIDDGEIIDRVEIQLDSRIRLLRANIIRLVMEEGTIRMYYYVENSKEYHGNELQYLEVNETLAPGIETLITSYPEYISVENLEVDLDSDKLQIATDLWEKGIIMTETPLEFID